MSVSAQRTRIAAIAQSYVTGIVTAVAGAPRRLTAADLPAVVVTTGEAQRQRDDNVIMISRQYNLVLLALPWQQGIELEAEQTCEPFFEAFEEAFLSRPSLQLADNTTPLEGVMNADLLGDTGVTNVELAGVGYAGIVFTLQVDSIRVLTRGH